MKDYRNLNRQYQQLKKINEIIINSITSDYKPIYKLNMLSSTKDNYFISLNINNIKFSSLIKNNIGWNNNFTEHHSLGYNLKNRFN